MFSKKWAIFALIVFVAPIILAACEGEEKIVEVTREVERVQTVIQQETIVETVVQQETVIVAGTPEVREVEVTREVEVPVEVIVTEEPEEAGPVEFMAADPSTYVYASIGEPESLDPAWNYETAGNTVIMNVYETLIFYNRQAASEFIPQLATDWTISDDGTVYTFNIRQGVTFHNGDPMTPEDVAWSWQRGLLQGGGFSPQWLLTEPFYGSGIYDVAELVNPDFVDDAESLQAVDPDVLLEICERTTAAIVADNDNWTLTVTLAQPWGPFLATIAAGWASVQDKAWAIEQGAWDGDCATWQNFYGVNEETTPLKEVMNGTGPYMLDHWTKGEEWVLVRNPNYWRTEPGWEGGPSGPASFERVVFQSVDEWGTRFAMLQAGDVDTAYVPREFVSQPDPLVGERCDYNADTLDFDCAPTENPDGPFRLFIGHPGVSRTDGMFIFDISTEGGNPLLGSGQMDGNGIPPDFFSDEHVRKAFNYCFDFDAYIQDALVGEAVQNVGVLIPGMLGYDQNGSVYSFDLDKCKEEIELAWDGAVAENGFRIQVAYNTGNVTRQTYSQILQAGFQQVDPKYVIEIIGLPWPSFLANIRGQRLPIFVSGWLEDLHDPHNWAQPFTVGTYAARQALPDDILSGYSDLVNAGVSSSDPAERDAIYKELQDYDYEQAIAIRGAVATGRRYEQRWVKGWYYNPIYPGQYFYSLSKE